MSQTSLTNLHYLKSDFKKQAKLFKKTFLISMVSEFSTKRLSGNLLDNGITLEFDRIIINPKKYDTAYYILSGRQTGGKGKLLFTSGSYANELNKKGSEFEVFKKKYPTTTPMTQLPLTDLERTKIYPRNHKRFIHTAILNSASRVARRYKGRIEKWQIQD